MSIPSNVKSILERIVANEGGFQNDPDDTGNYAGPNLVGTNYGITPQALATFKQVPVEEITEDDIKGLSKEDAIEIYAQDYYYRPGYDKIENDDLKENVVDMAVNAGAPQATKLLQRIVGADVDGILGPQTLQAINDSGIGTNDYVAERKRFYLDIAISDPAKLKFLPGWVARANKYTVSDYPEGGLIPFDVMAELDEEIKKPVAALPKEQVAKTTAKAVSAEDPFAFDMAWTGEQPLVARDTLDQAIADVTGDPYSGLNPLAISEEGLLARPTPTTRVASADPYSGLSPLAISEAGLSTRPTPTTRVASVDPYSDLNPLAISEAGLSTRPTPTVQMKSQQIPIRTPYANLVAEEIVPLTYDPDLFYGLGPIVDEYKDPDSYVGTINEKALFS